MADTFIGPVEATFTAVDQATDWLFCPRTAQVNVWNFGVATVQLQLRHVGASQDTVPQYDVDDSSDLKDLNQLIGPFEEQGVYIRAKCTAFSSGSIKVRINRLPGDENNLRQNAGDS